MNLKEEFSPNSDLSDYYIEDVIQRSVRDNIIKYSEPTLKYDLYELKNIWGLKTKDK